MQKTVTLEVKSIQLYHRPKPICGDPDWELIVNYQDISDENLTTQECRKFKTYEKFREALDKLVMEMEKES